jgi:hypothetical protein
VLIPWGFHRMEACRPEEWELRTCRVVMRVMKTSNEAQKARSLRMLSELAKECIYTSGARACNSARSSQILR